MPYVIMVYAKDEEVAEEIYKQHHPNYPKKNGSRAVGMYRLPSKDDETCTGYCQQGKTGKLNGWTRDKEEGFIVHQCGRPHKDRRSRLHTTLLDCLGINMLKRSITPSLFQNPQGYGE